MMIPPSSSAEILQAMGQSRPIAPKGLPTLLVQNIHVHVSCLIWGGVCNQYCWMVIGLKSATTVVTATLSMCT